MKNRIHLNSEEKFLVRIIIIVLIGLMIRSYGLHVQKQTIESAELTSVTENGYYSHFGDGIGEHYYTFD